MLFVISGALRQFAGSRSDIRVETAPGPLGRVLDGLWAECPAVRDRVLTERGDVRPHINIFVDGEDIRYTGGLDTDVRQGAEIFVVPAVSGGAGRRHCSLADAGSRRPPRRQSLRPVSL